MLTGMSLIAAVTDRIPTLSIYMCTINGGQEYVRFLTVVVSAVKLVEMF